jgi:hypothetical protein
MGPGLVETGIGALLIGGGMFLFLYWLQKEGLAHRYWHLKAKALNSKGGAPGRTYIQGPSIVLGRFRLTASKPGGRLRRNAIVQERSEGSDRV